MEFFVQKNSVVREIWGKSDTIIFIFIGASAEFALNKAVDWLYFTGRLPADPFGRLFSTVAYAREIIFDEKNTALAAIDKITAIHKAVENNRKAQIPNWAYRDVLFMLIAYSINAFQLMERKLSDKEKEEVFEVFYRVGERMGLKGLPQTYSEWIVMHGQHLQDNLIKSNFTTDLYRQYKKHLGAVRFKLFLEGQKLVVPQKVNKLLQLGNLSFLAPVLAIYKLARKFRLDEILKVFLLPKEHRANIKALDVSA